MGSHPLRHPDLIRIETAQRLTGNRRERLDGFCLKRTVATVQTEPLQPFGREQTDLPLLERYK